eukprot:1930252-Rhodomonas_salina.2
MWSACVHAPAVDACAQVGPEHRQMQALMMGAGLVRLGVGAPTGVHCLLLSHRDCDVPARALRVGGRAGLRVVEGGAERGGRLHARGGGSSSAAAAELRLGSLHSFGVYVDHLVGELDVEELLLDLLDLAQRVGERRSDAEQLLRVARALVHGRDPDPRERVVLEHRLFHAVCVLHLVGVALTLVPVEQKRFHPADDQAPANRVPNRCWDDVGQEPAPDVYLSTVCDAERHHHHVGERVLEPADRVHHERKVQHNQLPLPPQNTVISIAETVTVTSQTISPAYPAQICPSGSMCRSSDWREYRG